ncbi:hypothetical protein AB9P05_13140 [Roseivirga sp. BDSF3-8]|uniref:DUF7935 family protein n=1 Tax=Roseivirga sp. BDSF3-8 TaxID=3241598 RepID=UPI0035322947
MELLQELLKVLLPALAVLYAMYLVVKSFLDKEMEKKILDVRSKNAEIILPVRMQAYERICLFLERITPNNLLIRLNDGSYTARQFQQILVSEVRDEFNHNLSQQLYMSDDAWIMVKNAMQEVISVINESAKEVDPEGKSIELSRRIFEKMLAKDPDPIQQALTEVKDELRRIY